MPAAKKQKTEGKVGAPGPPLRTAYCVLRTKKIFVQEQPLPPSPTFPWACLRAAKLGQSTAEPKSGIMAISCHAGFTATSQPAASTNPYSLPWAF